MRREYFKDWMSVMQDAPFLRSVLIGQWVGICRLQVRHVTFICKYKCIFFSVNMIYFQRIANSNIATSCSPISYIQAYIHTCLHTYIVIHRHDTYWKILLIIANTILNRRKKIQKKYMIIKMILSIKNLIKVTMNSKQNWNYDNLGGKEFLPTYVRL